MSFDSLIMREISGELQKQIIGSVVQKIYEPERGTIIFNIYQRNSQVGLCFSTDPQYSRIHLTAKKVPGRTNPSSFCMLLRKYLVGARVAAIDNPFLERVLELAFSPSEGMPPVKLIAEIMGRRSNLILIDENSIILGAVKTTSSVKTFKRPISPGETYQPLQPQNKLNPLSMDLADFQQQILDKLNSGLEPEKSIFQTVNGISPLIAREMLFRSSWQTSHPDLSIPNLYSEIKKVFSKQGLSSSSPVSIPSRSIYSAFPLKHIPRDEQIAFSSVNEMLDQFYSRIISEIRDKQLKNKMSNAVEKRLKTLNIKLQNQETELQSSANADLYKLFGDLLLTYSNRVPRGAEIVSLPDPENQDHQIPVPLDRSCSASVNAQKHYKRYQKKKKGQLAINKQLKKTRAEIKYCQELLYAIESNSTSSLAEIEHELVEVGYLRSKTKEPRKQKDVPKPLAYRTSSGHTVLVGQNNRQNEYITFNIATRRDTWFHVRDIPGSHVILKEVPYPPGDQDIEESAFLAAYFSSGREHSNLAVDYTEIRHVRRRPGGRPGAVFYNNYNTVSINPQDSHLKKLFGL